MFDYTTKRELNFQSVDAGILQLIESRKQLVFEPDSAEKNLQNSMNCYCKYFETPLSERKCKFLCWWLIEHCPLISSNECSWWIIFHKWIIIFNKLSFIHYKKIQDTVKKHNWWEITWQIWVPLMLCLFYHNFMHTRSWQSKQFVVAYVEHEI